MKTIGVPAHNDLQWFGNGFDLGIRYDTRRDREEIKVELFRKRGLDPLGELRLKPSLYLEGVWAVDKVRLDKDLVGKGFALTLYLAALDVCGSIHGDWHHWINLPAARLYPRLIHYTTVFRKKTVYMIYPVKAPELLNRRRFAINYELDLTQFRDFYPVLRDSALITIKQGKPTPSVVEAVGSVITVDA